MLRNTWTVFDYRVRIAEIHEELACADGEEWARMKIKLDELLDELEELEQEGHGDQEAKTSDA